jgi:catechol 2,3-dioxygenase-like lactoylglutathione lyase family enzyme
MLSSCKLIAFVATTAPIRAKAFYQGTLGLPLVSEDAFALTFDVGGTPLRVSTVREIQAAEYTVLGWEVPDIEAAIKDLVGRGVVFQRYGHFPQDENAIWTAPGGARIAWFKDPDGNTLSLAQH